MFSSTDIARYYEILPNTFQLKYQLYINLKLNRLFLPQVSSRLMLTLSSLDGWTAQLTLELPSGFQPGTSDRLLPNTHTK